MLLRTLTVFGFLLAQQARGSSSRQTARAIEAQQRGTDSLPFAVKLLNTGKTKAESDEEDRRAGEATEINRKQLAANAIASGLALMGLGVSLWTFHRTRQITRQQLRAYVLVDSATVDERHGVPLFPIPANYTIVFKNFGQTPAYRVRLVYWYAIDVPDEAKVDFTIKPFDGPASEGVLGPGGALSAHIGYGDMPAEMKEAVRRNERRVYVFGRVTYRDAFGTEHTTNFRHRRQMDSHAISGGSSGNEAD